MTRHITAFLALALACTACDEAAEPPAPKPLEAVDDNVNTDEDAPVQIPVLDNDTEGASVVEVGMPDHGESILEGGGVRYVPGADFHGMDRFEVTIEKEGQRATSTVQVTVRPINDPPQAQRDLAWGPEGELFEIDVLANDTDVDGDALEIVRTSLASFGSVRIESGELIYTPKEGYRGADRFTYHVRDAGGVEAEAEVVVSVGGQNGDPIAVDDAIVVETGSEAILAVKDNDVSVDGDPLEVSLVGETRHVSAALAGGRVLIFAPVGFNGMEIVRYRIETADGRASEANIAVGVYDSAQDGAPIVAMPRQKISPREVAVIVNTDDPVSAALGLYYSQRRFIPTRNLIEVSLGTEEVVSPEAFGPVMEAVEMALPEGIQAYALAWLSPFRVGCMSMASAFAFGGFDRRFCNQTDRACGPTDPSPYFNSPSTRPFDDHGLRPAMMLAAVDEAGGRALVDRGVLADGSFPEGDGVFIRTTDEARSVRWPDFERAVADWEGVLSMEYVDNSAGMAQNALEGREDLLFYLTGLTRVPSLETLSFRPGALADHLTSFGGVLTDGNGQMSAVRWLEAGATASFGTAVEPCNYTTKFPQATVLVDHYHRGATAVEAYWKSVAWPGEGAFVGDPMASPWGRAVLEYEGGVLTIRTSALVPGERWVLEGARHPEGVYAVISEIEVDQRGVSEVVVEGLDRPFYRLVPASD